MNDNQIKIQRKGITRYISETSWKLLTAQQKSGWDIVSDGGATIVNKPTVSFIPEEVRSLKPSNPNAVTPIDLSTNGVSESIPAAEAEPKQKGKPGRKTQS